MGGKVREEASRFEEADSFSWAGSLQEEGPPPRRRTRLPLVGIATRGSRETKGHVSYHFIHPSAESPDSLSPESEESLSLELPSL